MRVRSRGQRTRSNSGYLLNKAKNHYQDGLGFARAPQTYANADACFQNAIGALMSCIDEDRSDDERFSSEAFDLLPIYYGSLSLLYAPDSFERKFYGDALRRIYDPQREDPRFSPIELMNLYEIIEARHSRRLCLHMACLLQLLTTKYSNFIVEDNMPLASYGRYYASEISKMADLLWFRLYELQMRVIRRAERRANQVHMDQPAAAEASLPPSEPPPLEEAPIYAGMKRNAEALSAEVADTPVDLVIRHGQFKSPKVEPQEQQQQQQQQLEKPSPQQRR